MTLDLRSCLAMLVLATTAAGCMSPLEDHAPPLTEEDLAGDEPVELSDLEHLLADSDYFFADSDQVAIARDCMYVEWCNRPASISPDIGTVCRLRTGCPYTVATIAECNRDISAVCGSRVDPAYVCRQNSAQCPHSFP